LIPPAPALVSAPMGLDDFQFRRLGFELKSGRMEAIAFGDPGRAPDLLFLHATGMNALTYRHMLAPLGERHSVLAVDLRGHGRSTLTPRRWGYVSWNRHRDDVIELLGKHFQGPVTLAGHSMGATTSLLVAGKRPDLTRGVCMLDPVIRPQLMDAPGGGEKRSAMASSAIARGARRRRDRFPSKAEAVRALTGRGFFTTFPPEVLEDYVEDGFAETPDGEVRLTCTPAYESATFMAQAHDSWSALERAAPPLVMLRAEKGSTTSDSAARRIETLRSDARLAVVEGSTHAMPMERPDRARAAIEMTLMLAAGQARFRDLEED
jgi:pimeloyl-ACP methyl ester carboxylesterase